MPAGVLGQLPAATILFRLDVKSATDRPPSLISRTVGAFKLPKKKTAWAFEQHLEGSIARNRGTERDMSITHVKSPGANVLTEVLFWKE